MYSSNEIVTLLGSVGFTGTRHAGRAIVGAATKLDGFHVFVATVSD